MAWMQISERHWRFDAPGFEGSVSRNRHGPWVGWWAWSYARAMVSGGAVGVPTRESAMRRVEEKWRECRETA